MLIPKANIQNITDLREKIDVFIDNVNKSELPTIVLKGSKPLFAAIKISYLQKLYDLLEDYEDTLLAYDLISKPEKGGKKIEEIAKEFGIKLD